MYQVSGGRESVILSKCIQDQAVGYSAVVPRCDKTVRTFLPRLDVEDVAVEHIH